MRARTPLIHRFLSSGILATTVALAPSLARAQDATDEATAEAKKQFIAGTRAFSAGKFSDAALAFESAAALKSNAVALYTAALAWEQASQSERAADDYGRAVLLNSGLGPERGGLNDQQLATARERLASLEKVLGTLEVTGPAGTKVQLDQFSQAPTPVRLHATGGTHSLNVSLLNKPNAEKREVLLEGNQTQKLDVTPSAPIVGTKVIAPTAPTQEGRTQTQGSHLSLTKALGFVSVGLGTASALGAVLLGISAQDAGDAYNAAPNHAAYVHANALADWSTGAWIGAGVCVALGVTLVLLPEKSSPPKSAALQAQRVDRAHLVVSPAPGGLVLRGSF